MSLNNGILKDISIEEIENGTVISYRFVGEYETKKKFFPTGHEAREWLCGEITKEIEHIAPLKIAAPDECPF